MPDWKDLRDVLAFSPLDAALFSVPAALLRHYGGLPLPAPPEEEK